MISLDRFKNLKDESFLKKASLVLSTFIKTKEELPGDYLELIFKRLEGLYPEEKNLIEGIKLKVSSEGYLSLKDFLDSKVGLQSVDFDFISSWEKLDKSKRLIEERYLFLDDIRSPFNIGSIVRSAESFKIKKLFVYSKFFSLDNPNFIRSSCRAQTVVDIEVFRERKDAVKKLQDLKLPIFSLECGGVDLYTFKFPKKAAVVIGSEEGGVSQDLLALSSAKISIPTFGAKASLNVSSATAIMLSLWAMV